MTGQNTAAAERSAHAPAAHTGAPAWLTEVAPGIWRITAYVERDQLRAQLAAAPLVGGIASARIIVQIRQGATAAELLTMAAEYATDRMQASPAILRAAATALVDRANRIETEGRR